VSILEFIPESVILNDSSAQIENKVIFLIKQHSLKVSEIEQICSNSADF